MIKINKCAVPDCMNIATDTHEIYSGNNRSTSIKYGLQVRVCNYCNCNRLSRSVNSKILRLVILGKYGIDGAHLDRIMRKCLKQWTDEDRQFVIKCGEIIKEVDE